MLYILGYGTGVTGMTADGNTAIGNTGRGGPIFTWTAKDGVKTIPNVYSAGNLTAISPNGQFIADDLIDPNTGIDIGACRWDTRTVGCKCLSSVPVMALPLPASPLPTRVRSSVLFTPTTRAPTITRSAGTPAWQTVRPSSTQKR